MLPGRQRYPGRRDAFVGEWKGRLPIHDENERIRVLEESGLDYEAIPIDGKLGQQHTPTFRAINPNGKVPAIIDDGVAVFDSNAILLYLAEKTGKFLPGDTPQDVVNAYTAAFDAVRNRDDFATIAAKRVGKKRLLGMGLAGLALLAGLIWLVLRRRR